MKWYEPGVLDPQSQVFLPEILAITLELPWIIPHDEDKAMKGHVVHRERTAMLCSVCTPTPLSYGSRGSDLSWAWPTHTGARRRARVNWPWTLCWGGCGRGFGPVVSAW